MAEIWKEPLLLNVEQYFSPMETFSFRQGVLGANALKHTLRKKSVRNKRDRSLSQEVKIIALDDLEVTFLPKEGPGWSDLQLPVIAKQEARRSRRMAAHCNSVGRQAQSSLLQLRIS